MTYWQPRIPIRFTSTDGGASFDFPLADYSYELDQSLRVPEAVATGAHGSVDLLADSLAPRDAGQLRLSFTVYEEAPEMVEVTVDAMLAAIYSIGRGKLWTIGRDPDGAEQLRWTRARALAMPSFRWQAGNVLSKAATVAFRTGAFWYGEIPVGGASDVAAQGTLTVAVQPVATDTFTIGGTEYSFQATGASIPGEVNVGADLAAAKINIVASINGTDGWNDVNPDASAAAFVANTCLVTARVPGTGGNALAFSETFTSGSNVMDGSGSLGATTAGVGGSSWAYNASIVVVNRGNAPIYNAIFTVEGSYSGVTITNTANGYKLHSARIGSLPIRFDAGRPAVEVYTGSTWLNDYANFTRQTGQVQLMVLEPGNNTITISGMSSGTLSIDAYPAWY